MKIGDKEFTTRKPADLEAQLAAAGSGVEEITRQLREGSPIAGQVAVALRPFLGKDAPSVPELAAAIAADDLGRIQVETASLYADVAEKAPAAAKSPANG